MVGLRDDRRTRYPHDGSQKEVIFAANRRLTSQERNEFQMEIA